MIAPIILAHTQANALSDTAYTGIISAYNIGAIQHTVTQNAFKSFSFQNTHSFKQQPKKEIIPSDPSVYGKPLTYGEYNEDGLAGRSGGDTISASLSNVWIDWQHLADKVNFDEISTLKTDTDIIMAGMSSTPSGTTHKKHNWGTYVGYVGGDQSNPDIQIDNHGGFFGIYNGLFVNDFTLKTTVNGGVFDISAHDNNFTNFWIGAATNASYDITLDKTFILRPSLQVGYTWIQTKDYTLTSGDIITNQNLNLIQITPEIQAIKHIGNGWFGQADVKYVMSFDNNPDTHINNVKLHGLSLDNYFEYSISVGTNVSDTNISATIGRHDGGIYGWFGGLNIKYVF